MIARHFHHPATTRVALIVGIIAVLVIAYSMSFGSMWDLWQTSDHHHGILVFPIVAFLVWRQRHEFADSQIRIDVRGLPLLMVLAVTWLVARLAGVQVIEHASALGMIPAAIWTLLGHRLATKLLFPLTFILAATPVGDALVPSLMVITADISTWLLRITGIPVLREGQYLSLPGGDFIVADVCSGVRYLITGGMLSLLYGYLTYKRWTKRVLLLAVASVTLVLTNGVRAYIVMAVASTTNHEYLGGRDHIYFGWLLFGIVMMSIMWIGARYADEEMIPTSREHPAEFAATVSHNALPMIIALGLIMLAITVKPLQADFGEVGAMVAAAAALLVFIFQLSRQRSGVIGSTGQAEAAHRPVALKDILVGVVALAVLLGTPRLITAVEAGAVHPVNADLLKPVLDCRETGAWKNRWWPTFEGPAVEHAVSFDCGGHAVNVYVAGYESALQGRELISSSHYVVPPGWDRFSRHSKRVTNGDDALPQDIAEVVNTRPGFESIVWYWYDIDGKTTSSPMKTKILQVLTMLQGRPAGGRVVVLETATGPDEVEARDRLASAAQDLIAR
jgi:exosortase A